MFSHPHAHRTGPRWDLLAATLKLYEKAISFSRINGFTQEEGLANELAARFCLLVELKREAEAFLRSAFFCYVKWGSHMKQQQLRMEFPHVFNQSVNQSIVPIAPVLNQTLDHLNALARPQKHADQSSVAGGSFKDRSNSQAVNSADVTTAKTSPSASSASQSTLSHNQTINQSVNQQPQFASLSWDHVDTAAVMKACQSFSVQTDLNKLVRSLLWLVIQTAGASRGTLLLKTGEKWQVELAVSVEDGKESPPSAEQANMPALTATTPTKESINKAMPMTLFNLVCSTSSTVLISGTDLDQPTHAADEYLVCHRAKACLAMPIMQQNKLTGILYLQNDHSADSFTRTHLQILQVLTQQAALSIENARLYSRLQDYTQELQTNNAELQREIVQRQEAQEDMRRAKEAAEKAAETKSAFLYVFDRQPSITHCTFVLWLTSFIHLLLFVYDVA